MQIAAPKLLAKGDYVRLETQINSIQGSRQLWYSIPQRYADSLSELSDGPLAGLLIPAMAKGRP